MITYSAWFGLNILALFLLDNAVLIRAHHTNKMTVNFLVHGVKSSHSEFLTSTNVFLQI